MRSVPVPPRNALTVLLLAPAFMMALTFFVAPIILVIVIAFTDDTTGGLTFENFGYVLTRPAYLGPAVRTVMLAGGAAFLAVVLALPASYFLALHSRRGRSWLFALTVTFWVSVLVRIVAWKVFLGPMGPIAFLGTPANAGRWMYGTVPVLLAMAYGALPLCLAVTFAAIAGLDRTVVEAARQLGASSWQVFRHVVLPLVARPVEIAFGLSFVYGMAAFLEAELLGDAKTIVIGTLLRDHFERALSWRTGSAIAILAVALAGSVIGVLLRTSVVTGAMRTR